jgi:phospholipid N-methyltransferase
VSGLSAETRAILAQEGLAPRKRLGQHFLVDRNVVSRMIALADVAPDEAVLEIGPGLGALTDALATRAARLYVVEYDRGLADVLRRTRHGVCAPSADSVCAALEQLASGTFSVPAWPSAAIQEFTWSARSKLLADVFDSLCPRHADGSPPSC